MCQHVTVSKQLGLLKHVHLDLNMVTPSGSVLLLADMRCYQVGNRLGMMAGVKNMEWNMAAVMQKGGTKLVDSGHFG